jgi:hypothetical protein
MQAAIWIGGRNVRHCIRFTVHPICLGCFVAEEAQTQKACGIIAIGAIALSASQFALAQTSPPDQSAQMASKPAL